MLIKTLIYEQKDDLYKSIYSFLKKESIEVISTSDYNTCIEKINEGGVYLIIASFNMPSIIDLVLKSKSDDIFRPIMIFNSISKIDKEIKKTLIQMGINVFYDIKIESEIIATQAINYITLYQAKKNAKSQNDVLRTLSTALEVRDYYTHGHGERVAILATTLYDELGFMDYEEREALRTSAIIHDVGKLGTPDNILKSNKKLTDKEFETIKNHPEDGVKICLKIVSDSRVIDIIQHHHEKMDGSGYPHGLQQNDIKPIVQIITICDIYDALTSDRSYRVRNTKEEAIQIMDEYFVKTGKINKEFYLKFKDLILSNMFDNLKYV